LFIFYQQPYILVDVIYFPHKYDFDVADRKHKNFITAAEVGAQFVFVPNEECDKSLLIGPPNASGQATLIDFCTNHPAEKLSERQMQELLHDSLKLASDKRGLVTQRYGGSSGTTKFSKLNRKYLKTIPKKLEVLMTVMIVVVAITSGGQ